MPAAAVLVVAGTVDVAGFDVVVGAETVVGADVVVGTVDVSGLDVVELLAPPQVNTEGPAVTSINTPNSQDRDFLPGIVYVVCPL